MLREYCIIGKPRGIKTVLEAEQEAEKFKQKKTEKQEISENLQTEEVNFNDLCEN